MSPTPRDASLSDDFQLSLERSRARRAVAAARRRWRHRRRGTTAVLIGAMTLAAGGALAHERASSQRASSASAMQRGDRGAGIGAVQRALGIPADGVYGPQTARAVRRFQRAKGLAVDGIIGPQTLGALGISAPARRQAGTTRPQAAPVSAPHPVLARIAACESGGDPDAVSADGRYRGKYQFDRATWRAMGGKGDPARASEAEQDQRAARLLATRGQSAWPNCA